MWGRLSIPLIHKSKAGEMARGQQLLRDFRKDSNNILGEHGQQVLLRMTGLWIG
jgi:hypothetical protein